MIHEQFGPVATLLFEQVYRQHGKPLPEGGVSVHTTEQRKRNPIGNAWHGGSSSVGLERLTVDEEVVGSNPSCHPQKKNYGMV